MWYDCLDRVFYVLNISLFVDVFQVAVLTAQFVQAYTWMKLKGAGMREDICN